MLIELFSSLSRKFRQRVGEQAKSEDDPISSYINAALKLDERADHLSAKMLGRLFSEREPALYERIKRHLDREVKYPP